MAHRLFHELSIIASREIIHMNCDRWKTSTPAYQLLFVTNPATLLHQRLATAQIFMTFDSMSFRPAYTRDPSVLMLLARSSQAPAIPQT